MELSPVECGDKIEVYDEMDAGRARKADGYPSPIELVLGD